MAHTIRTMYVLALAGLAFSVAASASLQCDNEDDDAAQSGIELLQRIPAELIPSKPMVRRLPTPIRWLHVPRTGASFAYTLLSSSEICPGIAASHMHVDRLGQISVNLVRHLCPGLSVDQNCEEDMFYDLCAESTIGKSWEMVSGKLVGFFRDPDIRLWSDYQFTNPDEEFAAWASERVGCLTKSLFMAERRQRRETGWHCEGHTPDENLVELAKARVHSGFAFIGMTDEWNLSICLFNTMFGNECHALQFQDFEPHTTNSSFNVAKLNGFHDMIDAPVYLEARRIYTERLNKYRVSDETCQPCAG